MSFSTTRVPGQLVFVNRRDLAIEACRIDADELTLPDGVIVRNVRNAPIGDFFGPTMVYCVIHDGFRPGYHRYMPVEATPNSSHERVALVGKPELEFEARAFGTVIGEVADDTLRKFRQHKSVVVDSTSLDLSDRIMGVDDFTSDGLYPSAPLRTYRYPDTNTNDE